MFRICLFSNSRVVPIAEIVALPVAQRSFRDQYTAFHWIVGAETREMMAFGPLDLIIPQLLPSSERVAAGLPTLIRTGALDTPQGNYLSLVPVAEELVSVSILATDHYPESHLNPLPFDSAAAQQLYAFVERERASMTQEGTEFSGYAPFTVTREALLSAFEREARTGSQLLADLGRPI